MTFWDLFVYVMLFVNTIALSVATIIDVIGLVVSIRVRDTEYFAAMMLFTVVTPFLWLSHLKMVQEILCELKL